ncbi:hypothetical protein PCASD_16811 [Puccinia coronata f. sp. avenae]|uniref:CSD domain-containing protein n=1 Tax=Puccinia coronata f. sp. avenae TaxID=200324 RepID=A0A2N5T031_9BASI|nr:hypothetical protein PCASD_16811 [Puccinia coronata f. sp. avenae]
MSLALESLAAEDQMLTPTPGSPNPYLPIDNSHDRLNSIQLSSDASGEFSVAHSPRSFLGPPGEGLAELRNALNPPWLHGVTGSPSLVTNHSADRAGRWVENARRHADQHQPLNFAEVAISHGMVAQRDLGLASLQLRQSPFIGKTDRATYDAALAGSKLKSSSPFDHAAFANKRGGGGSTNHASLTRRGAHDGHSGDGSSEEEETWPMPETPFMSTDVWSDDAAHRNALSKSSNKKLSSGAQPHLHDLNKTFPAHHHQHQHGQQRNKQAGARTQNLASATSAKEGERRIGRCKMYNCDKGVGFLIDDRLDQVSQDVKIHWTDIFSDQEFKSLAKGEIVEYTLNITANGYSASYVTGPGGRPVMGAEQAIVQASRQTSYKLFKAGALPVKTYRSKWESLLSPGESESAPGQPANPSPNVPRPMATPRTTPNVSDSPAVPASVPVGIRSFNQTGTKPSKFSSEQLKGSATEPRSTEKHDGQTRHLQERNRFNSAQAQLASGLTSAAQFNTPGWGALHSPLGYLQSANSLVTSFSGAHTPLPALSHSGMTPHSADSYNPIFPSGYTSSHLNASARSPAVTMGTPLDASHAFLTGQGLTPSQRVLSQPNFQSFLAERQLLLDQQALLMSMYQSANQPIPASAIQAFNQLSFMNPIGKSLSGKAGETKSLYDTQAVSTGVDTKSPFFGLLPPIALPNSRDSQKLSDVSKSSGIWRATDQTSIMKRDSSGSLRANAISFTPASGNNGSPYLAFGDGQVSPQAAQEGARKGESPVYQIPGRRSVSDPAMVAPAGAKKPHVIGNFHASRNPSSPRQVRQGAGQPKRVTFAEQSTPSRRVVSHGEQVGTPLMMRALEEEASDAGEESLVLSEKSTYTPSHQAYAADESRQSEDFSSVDIALERLRLAAGPHNSFAKPVIAPVSSTQEVPIKSATSSKTTEASSALDLLQQPTLSLLIEESGPNYQVEA